MDIVYFVRPSNYNDELKYSLRSLKNIPHGNVFMAGYMPGWTKNVKHIKAYHTPGSSNSNTNRQLEAIANDNRVSEDFILMNDDFFIMSYMDEIPRLNRGPIENVLAYYEPADSMYYHGMLSTSEYIKTLGYKDVLCYELHVPMVMNKTNIREMFSQYRKLNPGLPQLHKRTLYGNMFNYGGESIEDVKVFNYDQQFDKNSKFLSTTEGIWNKSEIGKFIREQFQEKSKYEQ